MKFRSLKTLIHIFLKTSYAKESTSVSWIPPGATKCYLCSWLPPLGIKLCQLQDQKSTPSLCPFLRPRGNGFKTLEILSKMHNPNLIMRKQLTNPNWGMSYKATGQKRNEKMSRPWKTKKLWKCSRLKEIKEKGQFKAMAGSGPVPGSGKENGHKRLNWPNWRKTNMACTLRNNIASMLNFLNFYHHTVVM